MGGSRPFVVQQRRENRPGRRLVGEAYVHGLLDGQSARECEAICSAPPAERESMGLVRYSFV